MRSIDAIRVTTVVDVPPATAFAVFTTDIGSWWRRDLRHGLNAGHGGILYFEPGARLVEVRDSGEVVEIGRVTTWQPGTRLTFEWRTRDFAPGEKTFVDVRFDPDPHGTRITLEHSGWGALPRHHPARLGLDNTAFPTVLGRFWADRLLALRHRVESDGTHRR